MVKDSAGDSDSRWMAAFYRCDNQAFDKIEKKWSPRLRRYFKRLGFQDADADDLVQDTLLRVYLTKRLV